MCKSLRQINEKGTDSLQASAEETAKYEVKSADYMTVDDERNLVVIKNLEYALCWSLVRLASSCKMASFS
ncbi:hypothetical protein ABMB44_13990 [Levilactobacillus brevis]